MTDEEVRRIPIERIRADPSQPRKNFGNIRELGESIEKYGLQQPITVRPIQNDEYDYEIVTGERRYHACKMIEMDSIQALVKKTSEEKKPWIQLVENIQRKDLDPIEEGEAYKKKVDEGYSHEEIAKKIGKSRVYVTKKVNLTEFSDSVKEKLAKGDISEGHVDALSGVDSSDDREDMLEKISDEDWSVKETRENVRHRTSSDENLTQKKKGDVSHRTSDKNVASEVNRNELAVWELLRRKNFVSLKSLESAYSEDRQMLEGLKDE